ncbi:hypothetical protein L3X38_035993 [Prunus dulcis]|uniref:Uncharacterized protein n=1 Tax=Prunus dulcis TaxID=3755 RepID=A0AAD4VM98_PRUDU|nr:hypothetical protein L3X38_035984 [Prunus dulcis]KAI5326914.1 hypothetical protein L3X38_035988 [Prunus dulcis]KAI5326919.1 hypothetical protein L3X38_035993 [Prunus dulcis]
MRKIRWPEASERAPKSLLKNCPTPPVPWLIPATMLADQGWDRFRIEGGSEVVLMGPMLPRTKVCVAVVEERSWLVVKLLRERRKSGF